MSLSSNVNDLALRMAQEIKAVKAQAGVSKYPAWVGNRTKIWNGQTSTYNLRGYSTIRLRGALGSARAGTGLCRITFIGDSLTAGHSLTRGTNDPVTFLRQSLESSGYRTGEMIQQFSFLGLDPRFTYSTGAPSNWGTLAAPWMILSAGQSFSHTARGEALEIIAAETSGPWTYSIDGGAPVTFTPANTAAVRRVVVTGLADTNHTVVITSTTGNARVWSVGFRPATGVVLHNAGISTSQTINWWVDDTGGPGPGFTMITSDTSTGVDTDCFVIELGVNDKGNAVTAQTYQDRLWSIASTAKGTGASVILVASQFAQNETPTTWGPYVSAIYTVADGLDLPVLDLSDRMGLWSEYNADGNTYDVAVDYVHFTPAGAALKAIAWADVLGIPTTAPSKHTHVAADISNTTTVGRSLMTATDAAAARTAITAPSSAVTISAGTGLTGGGDLTANRTLTVSYGSAAGTAVQGNDARVTADQAATTASIRTIGTGALQAAAGNHTHAAPANATTTSTGLIQLAGDLGGTATAPTVPGLAGKANTAHTHPVTDLTATGTRDATTFLRGDNTWAIPAGGAGGSSGADLDMNQDWVDTTPASPTSGLTMFSRFRARRIAAMVGPTGQDTALQPAFFSNRIAHWAAVNNTTTPTQFGIVTTPIGTPTAVANTTSTFYASNVRQSFRTSTTAGTGVGLRASTAQWFMSSNANHAGFFLVMRCGIWAATATNRMFFGLSSTVAALSPTVNPSTLFNQIGFGADSTDTQLQFMCNDGTGVSTKVPLGTAFPSQTGGANFWEFRLFTPSGAGSIVYWSAHRLHDGVIVQGSTTTDLPALNTMMAWNMHYSNGTTAAAGGIDIQSVYIETDN